MKRLVLGAVLAAALAPSAAQAMTYTRSVPVANCTVSAWGPDFTVTPDPRFPGITKSGTTGAETDCL